MLTFLKTLLRSQKGQALPIVLCLLAIGGATIAVSLSYATTSLNSSRILQDKIKGVYAAGAGVEHALWSLGSGTSPLTQLPGNLNQMEVTIQYEDKGTYNLSRHNDFLAIESEIVWDEVRLAYKYTITVIYQPGSGAPDIHLDEVRARLPDGYSYQIGSSADFPENLSTNDPDETIDEGAYLLTWVFSAPNPSVSEGDPIATQTFYMTGAGELNGYASWIKANRSDIGTIAEYNNTLYKITDVATRSGEGRTMAKIVTDTIIVDGTTYIVSWQIKS